MVSNWRIWLISALASWLLFVVVCNQFAKAETVVPNPVVLTSGGGSGNVASDTTNQITPTPNALLLAWVATNSSGTPSDHTISDTLTGTGSWTPLAEQRSGSCGTFFWAIAGAAPGSGALTFDYSPNAARRSWIVVEITTFDSGNPIAESVQGNDAAASLSLALTDIAAGNLIVSAIMDRGNNGNITPGATETELVEVSGGGANESRSQMQYGTDINPSWSTLDSGDQVAVAIEINDLQAVTLAVDDMQLTLAMDSPALTQRHILSASNMLVALALDAPPLTQQHLLSVSDSLITLAMDEPVLQSASTLDVDDLAISLALDSPALTQRHLLTIQDALLALSFEEVALTTGATLDVSETGITLSIDNVSLIQKHLLGSHNAVLSISIDHVHLQSPGDVAQGELKISFAIKQPAISMVGKRPAIDIVERQSDG